MRVRFAAILLVLGGCLPIPPLNEADLEPSLLDRPPIVVVGVASCSVEAARARARADLAARLETALRARESEERLDRKPAQRLRDWDGALAALEWEAARIVARSPAVIMGQDVCVTARVPVHVFRAAVERASEAGRRGPLAIAIIPLGLDHDATPDAYGLRETYGSSLRTALGSGRTPVAVLANDAIYATLEKLSFRADRPLGRTEVSDLSRALGGCAVVHGTTSLVEHGLSIDLALVDGEGRKLGGIDGHAADAAAAASLARRHALALKAALGLDPDVAR
jgi:hypothetical protein